MTLCKNCWDHHEPGTKCPPYVVMLCTKCAMEHPVPWDVVGMMNDPRSYCGCGAEASFEIKRDQEGNVVFQECGSIFEEM